MTRDARILLRASGEWPRRLGSLLALLVFGLSAPGQAQQTQPAPGGAAPSAGAASPGIVKFHKKLPASALTGRPDTDLVELSDGRRMRLGDIRRLGAAARKMRAARRGPLPAALTAKPAATGTPLRDSADLAAALKRPHADTVVLPSGRRVTVGMIRLVQPQAEKQLGRPLAAAAKRPDLSGRAVKVTAKSDWKDLLQRPDGTVLEAPDGTRVTVGELKQSLAASRPARRLPPAKR